jgi:hypothetical protein
MPCVCWTGPVCPVRDGSLPNPGLCACNGKRCEDQYCDFNRRTCSRIPTCVIGDGLAANTGKDCNCGRKICTPETGMVCLRAASRCTHASVAPIFVEISEGSCSDTDGMQLIESASGCQTAARGLPFYTREEYEEIPSGTSIIDFIPGCALYRGEKSIEADGFHNFALETQKVLGLNEQQRPYEECHPTDFLKKIDVHYANAAAAEVTPSVDESKTYDATRALENPDVSDVHDANAAAEVTPSIDESKTDDATRAKTDATNAKAGGVGGRRRTAQESNDPKTQFHDDAQIRASDLRKTSCNHKIIQEMRQCTYYATFYPVNSQMVIFNHEDDTNDGVASSMCTQTEPCLCQFISSDCPFANGKSANLKNCACGGQACTSTGDGLVCSKLEGQCSFSEVCPFSYNISSQAKGEMEITPNEDVCKCQDRECTPASGLVCHLNQDESGESLGSCGRSPQCQNMNGTVPNNGTCGCGEKIDCTNRTGLYCDAAASNVQSKCGCSPGFFKDPATGICETCAAGRFARYPMFRDDCTMCPPGFYNDDRGNTECKSCSDGVYTDSFGSIECTECPMGKEYVNGSLCKTCAGGKFQPSRNVNNAQCKICPKGWYNSDEGHTAERHEACQACDSWMTSDAGQIFCKSCPLGKMSPSDASHDCSECPRGWFGANDGNRMLCTGCPAGFMQFANGSAFCSRCASGKYTFDTEQNACQSCPKGFFRGAEDDSTQCKACDIGEEALMAGSVQCSKCDIGFYGSSRGECSPCPPNTHQDGKGATMCVPCTLGKVPNSKNTACEKPPWTTVLDCKRGQYLNDSDAQKNASRVRSVSDRRRLRQGPSEQNQRRANSKGWVPRLPMEQPPCAIRSMPISRGLQLDSSSPCSIRADGSVERNRHGGGRH